MPRLRTRAVDGSICLHGNLHADIEIEYTATAEWINGEPENYYQSGWQLDDFDPTHLRYMDRHGSDVVKPLPRWFDEEARRENALYAGVCRLLDREDHWTLCKGCEPVDEE